MLVNWFDSRNLMHTEPCSGQISTMVEGGMLPCQVSHILLFSFALICPDGMHFVGSIFVKAYRSFVQKIHTSYQGLHKDAMKLVRDVGLHKFVMPRKELRSSNRMLRWGLLEHF